MRESAARLANCGNRHARFAAGGSIATTRVSVRRLRTSGTKSRRRSRSSSWSLSEMPRTGPFWMRFIRCVTKPAILLRMRFEGTSATCWGSRGWFGGGGSEMMLGMMTMLPRPVHRFDQTRRQPPQQGKAAGRTDLVNHTLVGVEVHGQARIVLLDDHARRLLDRLGAHALSRWEGKEGFDRLSVDEGFGEGKPFDRKIGVVCHRSAQTLFDLMGRKEALGPGAEQSQARKGGCKGSVG